MAHEPERPAADPELAELRSDPELARVFFAETFDHLNTIEPSVLALEAAPDNAEALNEVFRPFHTIKGNAGWLGITSIEELAHRVEELLDRARSGAHRIGAPEIEVILAALDLLTSLTRDVESRLAGHEGADFRQQRQALLAEIDRLVGRAAAPPSAPVHTGQAADDQRSSSTLPAAPPEEPPHPAGAVAAEGSGKPTVKIDMRKLDGFVDLLGELAIVQSMIDQDARLLEGRDERFTRNLAQLHRITSELQRGAISMRLVPIRQTFQRMQRLVRDLSQKSGKPLKLVVWGEDTELDRKVVEEIADPLMHMLRNSVHHGIEDPDARRRAGKAPQGRLSLSAHHEGGNVVIAVGDDGCGLDTENIHRSAVAQGVIEPNAALSEAEIHALIFRPGFTTAREVTEISGRGIGMDVVRRNVEALRGRIEIRSRRGIGATFVIKLPLTLATVDGLLLSAGAQRFVLPTFAVHESFRPAGDRLHFVPGRGWIVQVRDQLLPLARLADLFNIPGAISDPSQAVVVVLEDDLRQLALMVDHLLGKQEIVIKSLGDALVNIMGVAGGAILADGQVGLILDGPGLITLAQRSVPSQAA